MDALNAVARRHNLVVIEDAGVALGARYKGRPVGSLGSPTCFSFHGRKVITTGEGGMITTDDEAFAEKARLIRSHGASVSDFVRHQSGGTVLQTYEEMGYNYRMTDVQAAIGLAQMAKLPSIVARKQELAARYDALLAELPEITPPFVPTNTEHSYQAYVVRLTRACQVDRRELLCRMAARNVSCRHTLTCHTEPYFRDLCGPVRLPVTEEVVETTIALPLYAAMTEDDQDYVLDALRESLAM
jgi:dTDP-4-amino-4,6-dideoxygalactose transaminase